LKENKEGLVKLGELLLEKEVIFTEDLEHVFGPRKFAPKEIIKESPKEINKESSKE
jgi:hypothetical protein